MNPLVVVEQDTSEYSRVRAGLVRDGWTVLEGFSGSAQEAPGSRGRDGRATVRAGVVDTAESAADAVLAALSGQGLLVLAVAERGVLDLLYEDLRHLGGLELRTGAEGAGPRLLTPEQQQLLRLLLAGETLATAAARLSISPRTADRRVAAARRLLGVGSTAAALRAARDKLG